MQTVIEELEEYQSSQGKLLLVQKEVSEWLHQKLTEMDEQGTRPQIPFDTLIRQVSEDRSISPRESMAILLRIVGANDTMFCDRTVIGLKWRMLKCQACGARYSSALNSCPNKTAHTTP